jgi:hypothetical protein
MADKPDTLRFLGESRETEGWVPTTFGDYAITYFVAASCLVDEVLEGRASAAVLIPPIGYAYRHARPGHNSDEMIDLAVQPDPSVPIHLCGEVFSRRGAWVEGALETAGTVAARILDS